MVPSFLLAPGKQSDSDYNNPSRPEMFNPLHNYTFTGTDGRTIYNDKVNKYSASDSSDQSVGSLVCWFKIPTGKELSDIWGGIVTVQYYDSYSPSNYVKFYNRLNDYSGYISAPGWRGSTNELDIHLYRGYITMDNTLGLSINYRNVNHSDDEIWTMCSYEVQLLYYK